MILKEEMKEHNSYDQLVETCEMHTSASCKVKRRNFSLRNKYNRILLENFMCKMLQTIHI